MEISPPIHGIQELPTAEVEKICAGEVVERPLSVVKELVENALDAQPTRISVELEDGGKQLIRVVDDGHGILFNELPLALKPHCTSKLRQLDDLFALTTLGFRGEALSSVATVSKVVVTSHHGSEELGGLIEMHGGMLVRHVASAIQRGTEVEVRELFFNTPARLKFLRSKQAETSQIASLLTSYALAYPAVRWTLSSGGRKLLTTDGNDDLKTILGDLVDRQLAQELHQIHFEFPPCEVTGFISAPHLHRHNRQRQWFFINRRPVINKLLYKAVDDAVREFMSPGKFPAGAFFLELPPEEIDVNVHPMKSEVNFAKPQEVYSLLSTAVRRALGAAAQRRQQQLTKGLSTVISPLEPQLQQVGAQPQSAPFADSSPDHLPTADDPGSDPDAPPGMISIPVYEATEPFVPPGTGDSPPTVRPVPAQTFEFPASAPDRHTAPPPLELYPAEEEELEPRSITQVAGGYLVIATDEGLYLVDQHAAHERILFEKLYEQYKSSQGKAPRQKLLFPLIVELSQGEAELAENYGQALNLLGFQADQGAGRNLVITEVPQAITEILTPELIHGMLDELEAQTQSTILAEQVKELAASLACRAAIKAGHYLGPGERKELIRQILLRWSSLTCPHGRPTIISLGKKELEAMFLR